MGIKKIMAALGALAVGITTLAVPCYASADDIVSEDKTEYGRAGIAWMIKDYWDHRDSIDVGCFDELGETPVSCTMKDVHITGNGSYEVSLSGYMVPEDQLEFVEVGNLGVEFSIDYEAFPDFVCTIDELEMDGATYTFNAQPELEETGDFFIMKIKNPWGDVADTTPEMDNKPWTTTQPIVIKFTVSGLPEDKVEDNAEEAIELVFGSGSVENDVADEPEVSEEAAPDVIAPAPTDDATDTTSAEESKADNKEKEEEDSDNIILYACIGGGVVVLGVIIALVVKKKK